MGVDQRDRRRFVAGAVILTAACLAVYANAIPNPFHFDDISLILNDPRVQGFQVGELLTGNYWYLPNTDRLYRPLTMLSYGVNWAVTHQAWAFRLPNLALHAGVCVALFSLTWRVYGSYAAALAAGLAFAVHALNSEPLNTIIGRADLLVTLLVLAAAVLYWDDADPWKQSRAWRPIGGALCAGAALLCKENAIIMVGLVALLDWYRSKPGSAGRKAAFWPRRLWRCYVPLLLVAGGYLVLRHHLLGSLTSGGDVVDYFDNYIAHPARVIDPAAGESALLVRWGTPLATVAHAVRLALLPNALCFDYSYAAFEPVRRLGDSRLWVGVGLLAGLAVAFVTSAFRQRRVALAIGLSAVTYSVVSNVVIVIGTIFGERLLYLPLAGYCMVSGLAADFAFRRVPEALPGHVWLTRRVVAAGLLAAGLFYAYLTVDRNRDWHSNRTLYESAYRVNPRSCKTLAGLAVNAYQDGDLRRALEYCNAVFHEQTGVAPEYWPVWRTAGMVLRRMGERAGDPQQKQFYAEQALAYFLKALQLGAAGDPDAMLGAAELLVELRRDYAQAIEIAGKLVGFRPTQARAHDELAYWLLQADPPELRDPQRALEHAREAHRLRPEVANYAATLADALAALGRDAEAIQVIREALEGLPADSPGVMEFQKRLDRLQHGPDQLPSPLPSSTQPQSDNGQE